MISRRRVVRLLLIGAAVVATADAAAMPREGSGLSRRGAHFSASLIDNSARMDVNNLDMAVTNHGSFAFDLITGNAGLIYPKGTTLTTIFAAGPWIGAKVSGETRVAIGEYSQEYAPGPMANGTYRPDAFEFRNYRIERGGQGFEDYLAYAVPQGAPVDGEGNPLLLGDATLWSVFNDANPSLHTNNAGSTLPLGVEVQQSVFAFNRSGPLGDVIFLQWKLRNRGSNTLQQTYFTIWGDPDVGGFADDLAACDTTLALGYAYNATNNDGQYGATPPAVGFLLLRGPIVPVASGAMDTLGMTSFGKYINGTDPVSHEESYNTMRGLTAGGDPIHVEGNPLLPITTFQVAGDPVAGTGWIDQAPSDRRVQVSTGPFTMAPGAEQTIMAAVVVGRGANRLASISELRANATAARMAFDQGFVLDLNVAAPSSSGVDEGAPLAFDVSASDPLGGAPSLHADGLPTGATFLDRGNSTGHFEWTPGFDQAGDYDVVFTATRGDGSSAAATTRITVRNVNRAPVADAGGPYTTFVGIPATLDGGGSTDPDGDALTYHWTFGDGDTGMGVRPAHSYAAPGTYDVGLTVSDGSATDGDATTLSVLDAFVARAFTVSGNKTIRLASGKSSWCAEVEPVGRSFPIASVDLGSVVMKSSGTGSVGSIRATGGKTAVGADRDGNGVGELTACFSKNDLRLLFSSVQGQASIPVTIEGNVITGGSFRAPLTVGVQGGGGPATVATTPTPLRSRGAFEFATTRAGSISIRLFDVSGRLVRTVAEERNATAGVHRVEFDARDDRGSALGAGIYFYRVVLPEGPAMGRVVVLP